MSLSVSILHWRTEDYFYIVKGRQTINSARLSSTMTYRQWIESECQFSLGEFPCCCFSTWRYSSLPISRRQTHLFLNILTTLPGMIQGFKKPVVSCCYGRNNSTGATIQGRYQPHQQIKLLDG